jgi:filamentous hemagglutinin family protein
MPYPPTSARSVRRDHHPVATCPATCGHPPLTLALSVAACFSLPAAALAQPTGLQAIHGTASMATQGNKTIITTQNGAGTSHSALNWQSFGVAPGTTTHFNQPGAASTAINRVLGNNPSAIFGTLSSNGKLVLVNPAGIAVGAGAVVDTAGFTASTLRMTDADALAGRLVFGDGGLAGGVSVNGHIVARGGDVVLIAPDVQTGAGAVIESPNGATILAAGRKVEVTGRGLEGIRLEVQAPEDKAVNLGQLKGDAVGIFAGTLKHSGLVNATAVSVEGGKVLLKGRESADIGGTITAQKGSLGGQVHATAAKVMLKSGAIIDASGAAGGGEVLLGGGWQGQDARLANAQQTTAEPGSTIRADATDNGNGGTVVLWSDGDTRSAAHLSARGGAQGGNGGRIETSGKVNLWSQGTRVDALAPHGSPGVWLLDPTSVTITGGGGAAAPNVVYENDIEAAGANVDIVADYGITTSGTFTSADVVVPAGLNLTIRTTGTSGGTGVDLTGAGPLTFKTSAGGNISLTSADITQSIKPSNLTVIGSGTININSSGPVDLSGVTLQTAGGAIGIAGIGVAATGQDAVLATQATITSTGGAVTLNGTHANVNRRGVYLDRTSINSGAGAITIGSTTANIKLMGSSVTSSGGNISITTAGAHNYSALEIVDYTGTPAVPSRISTTGSGNITLSGELTNYGSSAGSFAGGVVINNSTVSSFNGSITVQGKVGLPSGVAQVSRGFSLDTGAHISGNGVISLTGEVGASAAANSHGGMLASGATVASTGGNVSLSGTLNNASISAGTGLTIAGRVEAAGQIALTGSATVGNASGTGLDIQAGAVISSTSLGVTATGSVSSSTTATNLIAASVAGTISTTSAINVSGAVSAPNAVGASGVVVSGVITGTNSGNQITITGSGVPAPAPSSYRDLSLPGGTVSSTGGLIKLVGDRMELQGAINSSTGRTMVVPFSSNRSMVLAGSNETGTLNLTSSEINTITASALVVGGSTYTGGISITGAIAPANTNTLSLITDPTGASGIAQSAAPSPATISVLNLNADGPWVSLDHSGNSIINVAGRAQTGAFSVRSSGAMTVSTVDGTAGISVNSAGQTLTAQAGGVLTLNGNIASPNSAVSLSGTGITLNSTRSINGSSVLLNAGGGTMSLGAGSISSTGSIQLTSAAATTLGTISSATGGLSLTNISGNVSQQASTSVVTGLLSGSGNSGVINLSNTGNAFTSIGTLSTTGGGLTVVDQSGNLDITGNVTTGTGIINIRTPGNLTQSQIITSAATGDAWCCRPGATTSTPRALPPCRRPTAAGWCIPPALGNNNFNGLSSGNSAVYNATYAAMPGHDRRGQPLCVLVPAHGQHHGQRPDPRIRRQHHFAPVTHTVSGLVNASTYGNVFGQDILTGSLAVTAPGRTWAPTPSASAR